MALITLEQIEERETSSGFDARRLLVPCRNVEKDDPSEARCGSLVIWQSIMRKDGDRMNLPFDFHPVMKDDVLTQVKLVAHNCPKRKA
jgi:hypothetical protein